jgi:glutamyl-Q tRNA(Asp) synthetase
MPALRPYRGRFAPSPTGPLHLGSLVAATASYLQALSATGEWLLRIDDIDPPRQPAGAADQIIRALASHGFEWSGEIRWQSRQYAAHTAAVEALLEADLAYRCDCSRTDIQGLARAGPAGTVYPGICRGKPRGLVSSEQTAVRVRTAPAIVKFADGLRGQQQYRIDRDIGDIVIRRRDGLIAYALATVLDDHAQGITEVVRGTDLLAMTPGQIWLQKLLGLDEPRYLHVPIVRNATGQKLSKQTGARPVKLHAPSKNLCRALRCLGQSPPAELVGADPGLIWAWARQHWDPAQARRDSVAS